MLGGVPVLGVWLDVGVKVFVVPILALPPCMLSLLFEPVVLWVMPPIALVPTPVLGLCCFSPLVVFVALALPALSALVFVSLPVLLFESLLSFSFGLSFLLVKLWLMYFSRFCCIFFCSCLFSSILTCQSSIASIPLGTNFPALHVCLDYLIPIGFNFHFFCLYFNYSSTFRQIQGTPGTFTMFYNTTLPLYPFLFINSSY